MQFQVSIVIPVFNEVESIKPLLERLLPVLNSLGRSEVIIVDDGSTDGTRQVLVQLHKEYPEIIKIICLRTNCGKSIALQTGFDEVSGTLIVMMDGDLQDRPEEIPKLINYLEENNLDVVTGWKFNRFDPISKKLPSRLYNLVLRKFSGLYIHDFNCGLKVMRRECLKDLCLYGQLHRFMLVLLAEQGFRVGECKVEHSPRKYGYSKFKGRRLYEGLMDFLTIIFVTRYLHSPLHFFGLYGLVCFIVSFFYTLFFVVLHVISLVTHSPQGHLAEHPIWLLGPILFLIGVIFIFFGLIGELIYHVFSSQLRPKYIQKRIGFENKGEKNKGER